jgi:hypothetical protein
LDFFWIIFWYFFVFSYFFTGIQKWVTTSLMNDKVAFHRIPSCRNHLEKFKPDQISCYRFFKPLTWFDMTRIFLRSRSVLLIYENIY